MNNKPITDSWQAENADVRSTNRHEYPSFRLPSFRVSAPPAAARTSNTPKSTAPRKALHPEKHCRAWLDRALRDAYRDNPTELDYSGDILNEINLAMADNGGDLQAAVDHIADTVRRTENEFTTLTQRLPTGPAGHNPDLGKYLEALRWMIGGNLEWSYITPRYNGTGHAWNWHTDATVTLTPQRTIYSSAL